VYDIGLFFPENLYGLPHGRGYVLLGGIVYIPSLVSNLFSMIVNYIPGATEMVWNEMQQMEVSQPT